MWRYRDWVIDAFNSDMPYDEFTREQLAGDLMEHPTEEQILATVFHRNTMTNDEGGTDDEEFRVLAVKDRVDTTGQVWMGLTIGCAKCHSHKYDPITHSDYYRFFALLNQTEDADRGDEFPTVPMPTAGQKADKARLQGEIAKLKESFWVKLPGLAEKQPVWEKKLAAPNAWSTLEFSAGKGIGGSTLKGNDDGSISVAGAYPEIGRAHV